jgi:hypothetical protein
MVALVALGVAGIQSWRISSIETERDAAKAAQATAEQDLKTCQADFKDASKRGSATVERIEQRVIEQSGTSWRQGYEDGLAACIVAAPGVGRVPDSVRDCTVWLRPDEGGAAASDGSAEDRVLGGHAGDAAGQAGASPRDGLGRSQGGNQPP